MHRFIPVVLILISFNLHAKQKAVICPMVYYNSVKRNVEASGSYDKFKHCAVSCLLALRCSGVDVLQVGILKELMDLAGPGNADMRDLKADYEGVELVMRNQAANDNSCLESCHRLYPENSCK